MTRNRILLIAASGVSAAVIVYGLTAFVCWKWNPGSWPEEARFFCALFMAWFSIPAAATAAHFSEKQ